MGSLGAQWEYLAAERRPYLQYLLSNSFTWHGRKSISSLADDGVGERGEEQNNDGGYDDDDDRTEHVGRGAGKTAEKKADPAEIKTYKKQLSIVPDKHLKVMD